MAIAENFVSPKGELMWIFIDGDGKMDLNGNPRFSASLRLKNDSPQLKEINAQVSKFWEANKPKNKKMKSNGIKPETDKSKNYAETGYTLVNFWTGTQFPDGKPKKIDTYNAKGIKVDLGNKKIGNGSMGFISGAMAIYDQPASAGVTLYLNAIQLTKFVEYTGNVVLAKEEDGWTGEDLNPAGFSAQEEEKPELDGDIEY